MPARPKPLPGTIRGATAPRDGRDSNSPNRSLCHRGFLSSAVIQCKLDMTKQTRMTAVCVSIDHLRPSLLFTF